MSNDWQSARDYVDRMRKQGHSDEDIRPALRASGWSEPQIEALMQSTPSVGIPVAPPPAVIKQPPEKASGWAIATLVVGIVSLLLVPLAPVAIVLGIIALVQRRGGQALAIAGMVVAGVALLFIPIVAAILFPVFARARDKAQQTTCLSNVKQLALGHLMYVSDWDGYYPSAANWPEPLMPYTGNNRELYICPSDRRDAYQQCGDLELSYTMSVAFDQMKEEGVASPAEVVFLFEGTEVSGDRDVAAFRHFGYLNVAYVDGHAKSVDRERFADTPLEP